LHVVERIPTEAVTRDRDKRLCSCTNPNLPDSGRFQQREMSQSGWDKIEFQNPKCGCRADRWLWCRSPIRWGRFSGEIGTGRQLTVGGVTIDYCFSPHQVERYRPWMILIQKGNRIVARQKLGAAA
jgi:hypothetical protein